MKQLTHNEKELLRYRNMLIAINAITQEQDSAIEYATGSNVSFIKSTIEAVVKKYERIVRIEQYED